MTPSYAEEIAIKALLWVAAEPERISGFLGMTGASAEDLRAGAKNPEFLGFVLDYILMDDQNVLALADETDMRPEDVMQARQHLPGGANPEWT